MIKTIKAYKCSSSFRQTPFPSESKNLRPHRQPLSSTTASESLHLYTTLAKTTVNNHRPSKEPKNLKKASD